MTMAEDWVAMTVIFQVAVCFFRSITCLVG